MCVCVFWPPARPVCPNHELVEFEPRTVTGPDLGSVANTYTIFLSPCPTCSNRVLDHLFPSPWAYLLPPPHISPVDAVYLSLCTRFSLPILLGSGATVHLDDAPCLPAATACLHFTPLPDGPKEFLAQACACLPPYVCPPLPPSTCAQVPVGSSILPSMGPFLPLPVLNLTPDLPTLLSSTAGPVLFQS